MGRKREMNTINGNRKDCLLVWFKLTLRTDMNDDRALK